MTAWVKNLLVILIKSLVYGLLYALGLKPQWNKPTEAETSDSDTTVSPLEAATEDEQTQQ